MARLFIPKVRRAKNNRGIGPHTSKRDISWSKPLLLPWRIIGIHLIMRSELYDVGNRGNMRDSYGLCAPKRMIHFIFCTENDVARYLRASRGPARETQERKLGFGLPRSQLALHEAG